jgi:Glycosyl hydrolases family 25
MTALTWPDVSHYQKGVSLKGASLAAAKATQATGYVDPTYAGFKEQAKTLGIPFIAYHWLDGSGAVAQARHCFTTVGADVPLMIDDEQPRINVPHTLAFVAEYRRLGGLVTLEYLPHWVWESSGSPDLRPLARAGLLLVASNYSPGAAGGPGWAAYGGWAPTVLQTTSKQVFNGQQVDFNTYRGSLAQFLAQIKGVPMSQPIHLTDPVVATGSPGAGNRSVEVLLSDVWNVLMNSRTGFGALWASSPFAALAVMGTAIQGLTVAVKALGDHADTAAVLAAIGALADRESASLVAAQAEISALQAQLAAILPPAAG